MTQGRHGTAMNERFRVVTYNVHKCKGIDLRTSPARIADVLREIGADIIALQEVVSHHEGRKDEHQAKFIAEELGMSFTIGENRLHRGAGYGNVLLTRFNLEHTRNFDISVRGREQRGCLLADVRLTNSQMLHVYNLHLGTAIRERRHQVKRLLDSEILNREHFAPRLMLGDFNDWMKGITSRLLRSHFHNANPELHIPHRRTFPGFLPLITLDHIYYDSHLQVEDAFAHKTSLAKVASDHLPLVADFSFRLGSAT